MLWRLTRAALFVFAAVGVVRAHRQLSGHHALDELYGKSGKGAKGGRGGQWTGRKPHGTGGRSSAPRKDSPGKFNKAGKTGRSGKSS